ncbi:peptidyl-prolyl cis-trans isomerase FKBP65-like [Lathyrus oleraceus]|uniref:peptidyl-prolyl cis-trans isomerase FKBP65-like n=1 Tax=Pisum sativum TaxID=3888 RepID=UPI0021CF6F6C|nr:peptidyl-prolyl cis-trans isomerase FKBP65-like [Pisum sativum]XP_050877377.1 peptidyl-prolyl cis-trans isomerase FKBP65-like [Pisum sativum]
MSNCINSGINKVFVLTQFNSASLNRHISRTYFGNGINFGDGYVEVLDVEFHNVKALYRRAQAYIETGDFLLADVDIKKALEVDPQNREVKTLKTKVKQLQADSDKKDAKLYENMFAHKPKRLKVEKEEDEVVKTEMDNVGDSAAPSNGGLIIDSCPHL